MSQLDYNAVSYVKSSKYRTAVLTNLSHPKIPSELTEDTEFEQAHISRALGELQDKDIVELLVDEDTKKGRLYRLTEKGENIQAKMQEWADDE